MSESVWVRRTSPKTLENDIDTILTESKFEKFEPDKLTLIKINSNYDRDYPGSNTSTWFLDALLRVLKNKGFTNLKVVEGDLILQPATRTIKITGVADLLERHEIPFFTLEGLDRDEHELPYILRDAQLINVPVIHTHTFAVISCASKNLFGLLPIDRYKYHFVLSEKLLELVERVKTFTIVDGTVGLDGGSMRTGDPKRLDLILAGWHPLAIDRIAAEIMGFSPSEIPLLSLALKRKLLNDISANGEFNWNNLPRYNFVFKRTALVNITMWLHQNKYTNWFFDNKIIWKLENFARIMYITFVYHKKRKNLLNGPWMEYRAIKNKLTIGEESYD